MKRFAIIMLALIAINSSAAINSVEAKTTVKTTKIVRTVKRPKKKINRRLIRKRLTAYGKQKGLNYESNLKVNNSSWLPPLTIKYYINNKELRHHRIIQQTIKRYAGFAKMVVENLGFPFSRYAY